jgi:hypothetical protein
MNVLIFLIIGAVALFLLLGLARALLRYWEDQVQLTEENIDLERRVAHLNDDLANRRPDDEIVRILSGKESPTLGRDRPKKRR